MISAGGLEKEGGGLSSASGPTFDDVTANRVCAPAMLEIARFAERPMPKMCQRIFIYHPATRADSASNWRPVDSARGAAPG